MASNKKNLNKKTTKVNVVKRNEWQEIGLIAQLMFSFSVLFFGVVSFFNNAFLNPLEKLLGITLIVMGYNNHLTYKRKGMTVFYSILGLLIIFIAFMGW